MHLTWIRERGSSPSTRFTLPCVPGEIRAHASPHERTRPKFIYSIHFTAWRYLGTRPYLCVRAIIGACAPNAPIIKCEFAVDTRLPLFQGYSEFSCSLALGPNSHSGPRASGAFVTTTCGRRLAEPCLTSASGRGDVQGIRTYLGIAGWDDKRGALDQDKIGIGADRPNIANRDGTGCGASQLVSTLRPVYEGKKGKDPDRPNIYIFLGAYNRYLSGTCSPSRVASFVRNAPTP